MTRSQPCKYTTVSFPQKAVSLLINEYISQKDAKMKSTKRSKFDSVQYDTEVVEDDEADYESEDEFDLYGIEGISWSEIDDFSDNQSEDSEIAASPVFQMDLQLEISNCFKRLFQQHTFNIQEICRNLPSKQQTTLIEIMQ
jgi:hypothetical protein